MLAPLRRLVDWIAGYTLTPAGAVLRMAMGSVEALSPAEARRGYVPAPPSEDNPARLTPARQRILDVLADGLPRPAAALALEAGCSAGVVRGMVEAGLLDEIGIAARPRRPVPDWRLPFPMLSPDQAEAAETISVAVRAQRYETFLLDGVTGSGKTEVYFRADRGGARSWATGAGAAAGDCTGRAVASAVRGAIRLPGGRLAFRCRQHRAPRRLARRGSGQGAKVVVGARSALFLPFPDLGLIVVDEEHESAFKQEEGVIYHARDMAVVRASLEGVPIVLASATPSLESLVNAERGRYTRIVLPDRHGGAQMPGIELIDLRVDKPARQRFLAPALVEALTRTLAEGEQAMLFLNRRGYAPLTLCRTCGHRLQCPNCTAWLVEHRFMGRLVCHHCRLTCRKAKPELCPSCEDKNSFAPCGPGVERGAAAEGGRRTLPQGAHGRR